MGPENSNTSPFLMDKGWDLFRQLRGRKTAYSLLPSEGPLPEDYLAPGGSTERVLDTDSASHGHHGYLQHRKREQTIHSFLYRDGPMRNPVVVDIEASYSRTFVELREIAVIDFESGDVLLNKVYESPPTLSFLSGKTEGITVEDCANFQQQLSNLLRGRTWIGHNIQYDFDVIDMIIGFRHSRPSNLDISLEDVDLIDTRFISLLLSPLSSNHDLKSSCERIQYLPDKTHTALDDSISARELAIWFRTGDSGHVLPEVENNDIQEVLSQLPPLHPLKRLVGATSERQPQRFQPSRVRFRLPAQENKENPRQVVSEASSEATIEQFTQFLRSNDMEPYRGQKAFIKQCIDGIHDGKHCVIEAGTGTGKTKAYIALADEMTRCGYKVTIGTPTKALQGQAWNDLHSYRRWQKEQNPDNDLRIALQVGLGNFFSIQHIDTLARTKHHDQPGLTFLIAFLMLRLYRFDPDRSDSPIEETNDGSNDPYPDLQVYRYLQLGQIDELPGPLKQTIRAEGIPMGSLRCAPGESPRLKWLRELHFPTVSRRQARRADIVIQNLSLLFHERLLAKPEQEERSPDVLIIDEAHRILDEGTSALSRELSSQQLALLIRDTRTLITDADKKEKDIGDLKLSAINTILDRLELTAEKWLKKTRQILKKMYTDEEFDSIGDIDEFPTRTVSYRDLEVKDPLWQPQEQHIEELNRGFSAVHGELAQGLKKLGDRKEIEQDEDRTFYRDRIESTSIRWDELRTTSELILKFRGRLRATKGELQADVLSFRDEEPLGVIGKLNPSKWARFGKTPLWKKSPSATGKSSHLWPVTIQLAPLWPGDQLRKIWDDTRSTIFTSGTLRIDDSYDQWREWSGCSEDRERLLEPIEEFSIADRIQVHRSASIVPVGLFRSDEIDQSIAAEIHRAVCMLGGGTLSLFTSKKTLRIAADLLRFSASIEGEGLEVLVQEAGGLSSTELMKSFQSTGNTPSNKVLLGARTFWEGFDAEGSALRHLIIPKLPFPPIGDPVHSARSEWYDLDLGDEKSLGGFEGYVLPCMLQTLRQGIGRGIRSAEDHCTIIIFDARAVFSNYSDRIARLFVRKSNSEKDPASVFQYQTEAAPQCYLLIRASQGRLDERTKLFRTEMEHRSLSECLEISRTDEVDAKIDLAFRNFSGIQGDHSIWDHQKSAIKEMISDRDSRTTRIYVRPTGAGKSAIYKTVAGIESADYGMTIVVSPLIALMTDQALADKNGVASVRSLDSRQTATQRKTNLAALATPQISIQLLFLSPERLADPALISALKSRKISRIVIDEAHLLLHWADGFRPAYLRIPRFIERIEKLQGDHIPLTLFTATLRDTQTDSITRRIGRRVKVQRDPDPDPEYRPNLVPEIVRPQQELTSARHRKLWQLEKLREYILNERGQCLVFATTKKQVLGWTWALRQVVPPSIRVSPYFSGIPDREKIEQQFNEGDPAKNKVLISTSAYGMGVDNRRISAVFHVSLPLLLDQFVQECGRAGRDPDSPGKHVLLLPAISSSTRNSETFKKLLSSSKIIEKKQLEKLDSFLNRQRKSGTPVLSTGLHGSLSRSSNELRLLIEAEGMGLGIIHGTVPGEFFIGSRDSGFDTSLLSQEEGKRSWSWNADVCPSEAWEYMVRLHERLRLGELSFNTTMEQRIAFTLLKKPTEVELEELFNSIRKGALERHSFSDDAGAEDSEITQVLTTDQCLRTAIYSPFSSSDTAPHCIEGGRHCSNCQKNHAPPGLQSVDLKNPDESIVKRRWKQLEDKLEVSEVDDSGEFVVEPVSDEGLHRYLLRMKEKALADWAN